MPWIEVTIRLEDRFREATIDKLFEWGATGIQESDLAGSLSAYFDPSVKKTLDKKLRTHFRKLGSVFASASVPHWDIREVEDENWAERYKDFYFAQPLSELFFLKPLWDKTTVPSGMIPILMEPGQAFGTGLHPTTRLTLKKMQQLLESDPPSPDLRLADVGTGSGILAIAAEKMGVQHILGLDTDPQAIQTARENLSANNCRHIELDSRTLRPREQAFDLIVSNILLEAHVELSEAYRSCLKKNGRLILSGLLVPQLRELNQCLRPQELVPESWETLQEWACITYRLKPNT